MLRYDGILKIFLAAAGTLLLFLVLMSSMRSSTFLLEFTRVVLIDFGRIAVWPLAIVGLVYILRAQIGELVQWLTQRRPAVEPVGPATQAPIDKKNSE